MELFFQHFQKLKVSLIDYEKIIKDNEKINHKVFNTIILNMINNVKNENDKGTLQLLRKNIYDSEIFEHYSVKSQLLYIIIMIILLIIIYRLFIKK